MNDIAETLVIPRLRKMEELYGVRLSKTAVAMTLAIGCQESRFKVRDQIVTGKPEGKIGPATGFWQFEKNGGVTGVMTHPTSRGTALRCCQEFKVEFDKTAIWTAFTKEENDGLACSFARLLLLTDPAPLPIASVANEDVAWAYYLRNWRPGKPHSGSWGKCWRQAIAINVPIITTIS